LKINNVICKILISYVYLYASTLIVDKPNLVIILEDGYKVSRLMDPVG